MNAKEVLGEVGALVVLGACLGGCGGSTRAFGGCVKDCIYGCVTYCNDFHDTSVDTGKDLCAAHTWIEGKTCADLGYTKDCGGNVHMKPADACT
jgi:hypothetical protein